MISIHGIQLLHQVDLRCEAIGLYLAIRSVRESEPVLICPAFVATAMSAIVESSVSPERCDTTAV